MNYFGTDGQAVSAAKQTLRTALWQAALWLTLSCASVTFAQTTAFTYQGKLTDAGNPANGTYDLQFRLFDAAAGGSLIGTALVLDDVTVSNGIFTVTLDFGAAAFPGANRFLEISVRPGVSVGAFTTLAPLQPISATPYALRSQAATSADGLSAACVNCVTSSQIQTVDGSQITGEIPVVSVPTGSGNYIQNAGAGGQGGKRAVAQQGGFDITGDGIIGGNLIVNGATGIGVANPTNPLSVFSAASGIPAIYGESADSRGVWGKSVSSRGVYGESSSSEGVFGISNTWRGVAGFSTSGPGVYGESAAINLLTSAAIYGKATGTGGTGVYGLSLGSGGVGLYGESGTGRGVWGKSTSRRGVYGESVSNVGVWGISSSFTGVFGGSTTGYGVDGTTASAASFGGHFTNTGGGKALRVDGTGSLSVVEITGGSDLAEKFEVEDTTKPGMVVAIDSQNPGRLVISRGAYNRRVAGIISGANNLSAGMILPDLAGEQATHALPVALSGRVWVYCDATRQPIQPGDLLTTSATPGHAMKVANHAKAQGAIIGKAMTGLKTGRGLVLVLVSLQ